MSELPAPGTPDHITLDKTLSALDTLSELWAAEIDLPAMAEKMATGPRENLARAFKALAKQSFVEGAYRHHCAVNDGECPHPTYEELTQALSESRAECEGLRAEKESAAAECRALKRCWPRAVKRAFDHGPNHLYPAWIIGHAEELVADAIATQRANSENER